MIQDQHPDKTLESSLKLALNQEHSYCKTPTAIHEAVLSEKEKTQILLGYAIKKKVKKQVLSTPTVEKLFNALLGLHCSQNRRPFHSPLWTST